MLSIVLDGFDLRMGTYMDFVIFVDYIALPQYMGSKCVGGLEGSLGVDWFLGKSKFWCSFMLSIVMVVFWLGMDDLWIS